MPSGIEEAQHFQHLGAAVEQMPTRVESLRKIRLAAHPDDVQMNRDAACIRTSLEEAAIENVENVNISVVTTKDRTAFISRIAQRIL